MSAKIVELGNSNDLDYSSKSQSLFGTNQSSESYKFQIGVPQPNLTNDWWTTFTAIPASENPLNSANEGLIDDIPQSGNIHFLGGVFSESRPIKRDITVADDQTIVFPILTSGVDNVGWDFSFLPGHEDSLVPYQFSIEDFQTLTDAIMDAAERVSLKVNNKLLITDANKDQYRVASDHPYTLELPETDDILGYRSLYPEENYPGWLEFPYTQGMQDGIWVALEDLPLGENTIRFKGTIDYGDIAVSDYDGSGSIGDTPLEFLLNVLKDSNFSFSLNVTYNIDVISRTEFNTELGI